MAGYDNHKCQFTISVGWVERTEKAAAGIPNTSNPTYRRIHSRT